MGKFIAGYAVEQEYKKNGAQIPYMLALLTEAVGRFGQPEPGLAQLNEALALVEQTKHRTWEPELHRLRGELLLQTGGIGMKDESSRITSEAC